MRPVVIKVGGSLYDSPDLGPRLRAFCATLAAPALIVPGGGKAADAVRDLDRAQRLGEETSHWLALRACTINGHALATLLNCPISVAPSPEPIAVVDLFSFALADDARPDHWPHLWDVTSDSMAVRVAAMANARELILFKSIDIVGDWFAAASRGDVDPFFPIALAHVPELQVRAINFRTAS